MVENGNNALEVIKGMIQEGLGENIDSEEIGSFMDFLATFTEYKTKNSEETADRTANVIKLSKNPPNGPSLRN